MESIYNGLSEKVNEFKGEIVEISKKIYDYSELAFNEYRSSKLLADTLKKYGFIVEEGAGELKTAFKASFKGKSEYPTVAFLAEYDALPGVGHGCGHNLIGPLSVFSAIALSRVLDKFDGNIVVMGTPAEEVGGGKIILMEKGAFEDVNYSIMAHPSSIDEVGRKSRAITGIAIEFFGKSAHSSTPELGINALKAVINTFVGIDSISQTFPSGVSTNGIIVDGGKADNIIPDYASCQFTVRANTREDILKVLEKFQLVVKASEILTGATSKMEIETIYAERLPNMTMELRYKEHMERLGHEVSIANPTGNFGSSDIGNVSLCMPIVHAYFKIMEEPVNSHSKDFAIRTITNTAYDGLIDSCKALAMLGADLLIDTAFRINVDNEFEANKKNNSK